MKAGPATLINGTMPTSPVDRAEALRAAAFHNVVQLAYVSLLVGTADVFYLALPVGAWTVVSGIVIGTVSRVLIDRFPAATAIKRKA